MHNVKQPERMIPFINSEIAFRQHVRELVSGVNIFDLVFWVQIDFSNNQFNTTLWVLDVSHRQTSAFDDHFDRSFFVFKNVQLDFEVRRFCACDKVQITHHFLDILPLS